MESPDILMNSGLPVVTAFVLGLLTAISPCPLATNITAIGFISRDIGNRKRIFRNGLLYTLGRIITYTLLGLLVIPILREGHLGREVEVNGKVMLNLSSNDYLGLAAYLPLRTEFLDRKSVV